MDINKYENSIFGFAALALVAPILTRSFILWVPGAVLVGIVGVLWIVRYRSGITTEMRFLGGFLLSFGLLITIVALLPSEDPVPPSVAGLLLGIAILGLGCGLLAAYWPWIRMRLDVRTDSGVRRFVAVLESPDPVDRREAAAWLGRSGSASAILPLSAALQDEDDEVSAAALGSLERLRAIAIPVLQTAIQDADTEARLLATATLGRLAGPSAIPALLARLRDDSPDVRAAAVWALGQQRAREALPLLSDIASADTARDSSGVPLTSLAQNAIAQIHGDA